jgi:RNA polymerase sigma-70 factor (TIGR02960 family)
VIEDRLGRARTGDEAAFRELTEQYRRELHVHCYRMLGSFEDAEDALQETLIAAWRGLATFEGRSGLRTWLYKIATNSCLNARRSRARRPDTSRAHLLPRPSREGEVPWLEPYPDLLLEDMPDRVPGPDARIDQRESVGLAFVAAVQLLPPQQRAVLVLRDVLGYRAAEAADLLGTTEAAVNSALRRARRGLTGDGAHDGERHERLEAGECSPIARDVAALPKSPEDRRAVADFVAAFERGDVAGIVALLRDDAVFTMPPTAFEYVGHRAIAEILNKAVFREGTRSFVLLPTSANGGRAAFGFYAVDHAKAKAKAGAGADAEEEARADGLGVMVLSVRDGEVAGFDSFVFLGEYNSLPWFGLPMSLPVSHLAAPHRVR